MDQEINAFSIIVPCFYLTSEKREKVKACLTVSENRYTLFLLPVGSQSAPYEIDISSYSYLKLKFGCCEFVGDKDWFKLFFIDENSHQNRFIYALVDCGIIVPKDRHYFVIINEPTFVSNGSFQINNVSVSSNIDSIFKFRYESLQNVKDKNINERYMLYAGEYYKQIMHNN